MSSTYDEKAAARTEEKKTRWTTAGWLKGMVLNDEDDMSRLLIMIAERLVAPNEDESELQALGKLWRMGGQTSEGVHAEVLRRLNAGYLLEELAKTISDELETVARSHFESAYDIHSRFYQDGGTLLHYAGLNTFYGGYALDAHGLKSTCA